MKTKKSTLELTPLLDVVLILLFVFMLMLANQVNESAQVKQEADETVAATQEELDKALMDAGDLEDELEALQEDNDSLRQTGNETQEQLERQKAISDEQQDTAEALSKAVADFIDANEYDIKKLLDEENAPSQEMLDSMSIDDIAEEMLKYEALSRQFYFIDVELMSSNNRFFINGESTSLGIANSDLEDEKYIRDKIDEIKELIEDDMEKRQGGSQMVFITLEVHDRQVSQDAWQVAWDAIGEIQEKYGTDKIFRTHITIIQN